jgi:serine/threonine protein kinase
MALNPGTPLGPYKILAPIGTGGMAEVYRALDTKLSREVAVKVLPEAFARDIDRLGRFKREARLLASLNHPNIAAIYDIEESDGTKQTESQFAASTPTGLFQGDFDRGVIGFRDYDVSANRQRFVMT